MLYHPLLSQLADLCLVHAQQLGQYRVSMFAEPRTKMADFAR